MTRDRITMVGLRPLGTAEILDGAVRLVRDNARPVFALSLPFALLNTVLVALLRLAVFSDHGLGVLAQVGTLTAAVLTRTLLTGLLAPVFASVLVDQPIGARSAIARVARAVPALVVLAVVVAVGEGAGLVAFVVGGVWLWGIWAVSGPALVLERLGPFAALRRSFRLVSSSFWHVWGVRALGWVLVQVLGVLIVVLFDALALYVTHTGIGNVTDVGHPGTYVLIIAIGGLISSTVLAPVSVAIDVLLYTDLRMRREGMDIVLGLAPYPPAPAPARHPVTAW